MTEHLPGVKSMFLAVELEEDMKKQFADTLYLRRYQSEIRWEATRDFHVTLGFIKDVKGTDRQAVIKCFEALKDEVCFDLQVDGTVMLGRFNQIMCVRIGPDEVLQNLSRKAGLTLSENTPYKFDDTHENYIPHTKIQALKHKVPEEKRHEIIDVFKAIDTRKLKFTVTRLALMERQKKHYEGIKRYPLKA